jgi:acetyl esterase/lipase
MIIRSKLIPVAVLSLGLAAWAGPASSAPSQADIPYATSAAGTPLKLDLYLPPAAGAPLLVWLHGGAWENGNKSAMPLAPFVERGFAVASVDFSPASKARFPGQVHEIKAAIRFLRAEATRYGYDASRIAILGASSGAHLADVVGTSNGNAELEGTLGDHRDQSSDVHAIVSYFAATNLTTILAQSTPFGLNIREPALQRLLGAPPKEAEALAKLASPVFQVDRNDPPLLLLHGDQDPQMPINQSHELEGAYERQGLQVDFIVVHGAAHGGDAFYSPENVERVATFLGAQLRRGAEASAVPAPAATARDRI